MVHLVRPASVDDPTRPSGGNVYDRRIAEALGAVVHTSTVTVPDGEVALVDGLLATSWLVAESRRIRVVVLVHMPRRQPWEREVLTAAAGVIATSEWTRSWLLAEYALDPARVHVAAPGVDPAPLVAGSPEGRRLLCVGAVTALKGYDVLEAALDLVEDLDWVCVGVGSTEIEPAFAAAVGPAIRLVGPQTPDRLATTYAQADLLVLASRAETYGMVVTEALAHGLPVLATDVGGVRESLGGGGVLVPADDPQALAAALRRWLCDSVHRADLRAAARQRRALLTGWDRTSALVAEALLEAAW